MTNFKFNLPTKLFFGRGQVDKIAKAGLPGKKAMIVISSGKSVIENGSLARVEAQLDAAKIEHFTFNKVQPNPRAQDIDEGAAIAIEKGCDMIIGLGGGSTIDTAKHIALVAANGGKLWDYVFGGTGKFQRLTKPALPIIAIPTTAGTGSEMDQWAVATNELNEKIGFGNDSTFPTIAIVDPTLMMTVPAHLTAYQGFDALFHATECYISLRSTFASDMFCERAISLISKSIATAVADGSNEQARDDMALGSTMAGMAEGTSFLAGHHAMEHALSANHPALPHGAGLIMLALGYYKTLANSGACDEKMITMAKLMGKADASSAMDFVDMLAKLIKDCKMDELKMSDYGIDKARFAEYIANSKATNGIMLKCDPKPITDEQWMAVLEESYK